jgi:hypothetical protein
LKAAGISPVKGAGISLALVMMFAMAFAACDNGTSSSKSDNGPNVTGPSVMGTGVTANSWEEVELLLESTAPEHAIIYIRKAMYVPTGTPTNVNEVPVKNGKTLVIVGEISTTNTSEAELPEGVNYLTTPNTSAPRLYIQKHAKLTVEAGGRLVLGGPESDVYGGIVNVLDGGALHVKKGSLLSLNMSSNVFVSGLNSDGVPDYIALNIESDANLAVVGNFERGDTIITIESDIAHLIGVSRADSPVALGEALVYDKIPTLAAGEPRTENAEWKAAYNNNRREVARYSKIKVANSPQEVLEHINNAPLYPLVTLIYSGPAALIELPATPGVLEIPASSYGYTIPTPTPTTLVIQNNVQQNKDLKIRGAVEIAEGASIRVEMYQNTPATLTLENGTAKASLNIVRGATLEVGAGGTLNLSNIPTSDKEVITLNGEITVAASGQIYLPQVDDTADPNVPQVYWGGGRVTLAAGSYAHQDIYNDNDYDPVYYIGPASAVYIPEFSWTPGYTDSTVTIVGLDITLDGYLTVTKSTAIAKKATVASGVLTVANNANGTAANSFNIRGQLEVASGAKVVVAQYGILNFAWLPVPGIGQTVPVTLIGDIEVREGGILVLPKPQANGKVTQINYTGSGKIKLDTGSVLTTANLIGVSLPVTQVVHFAPSAIPTPPSYLQTASTKYYAWSGANDDTSYVELTNDSMLLSGTVSGALKVVSDVTVYNKFTISNKATLTIAANPSATGNALKLTDGAQLVVDGTIALEGGTNAGYGGILNLVENQNASGDKLALTLNGTITAGAHATVDLLDLASDQIKWGGSGEIKFSKDSLLNTKKTGDSSATAHLTTAADGPFTWGGGTTNSVTLKKTTQMQMIVTGELTAGDGTSGAGTLTIEDTAITVRNSGKLSITNGDTLLLWTDATITVEDGGVFALSSTSGGTGKNLSLGQSTSKLILNPGATLSAFSGGDSIVGYRGSTPSEEKHVQVSVTQTLGGGLTYIYATPYSTDAVGKKITVYSIPSANFGYGTGTGLLRVGKFTATYPPVGYTAVINKANGAAVEGSPAASDGSITAGKAGPNGPVYGYDVLDAYITFEGTVDADA